MTNIDRASVVARARDGIDAFLDTLARLVAIRSESNPPDLPALETYCREGVGPLLSAMGFEVEIHPNPEPQAGPFLVARRHEGTGPTVLVYGHGDVVRAMPERWRDGLDPWTLTREGDRIYGRGTVDNKGQHLIAIEALRAVIGARGRLGFDATVLIEMGEEAGSPGLEAFVGANRDLLAADVMVALDGPRQSMEVADITLGTRGGLAMDLVVDLRPGSHHSGHWGGLLKDPAVVLAHALASIVSRDGRILVEGWRPEVPDAVRAAARAVSVAPAPGTPEPDADWGEPGLSRTERISAWNSAIVLAMIAGQPENPVPAVAGTARARLQLRHVVDTPPRDVVPALRRHLDAAGFPEVAVEPVEGRDAFPPSRTDPEDPWVARVAASIARTTGRAPNVIPTIGASGPSEIFRAALGVPVLWLPQSYGGCGQHGPDEHGLIPLFEEGLAMMAGLFWDIGSQDGGGPG